MDRIRAIIADSEYQSQLKMVEEKEAERIFCKHDYQHALWVARLAYIIVLENVQQREALPKPLIYAAGLLHDIGRWVEYQTGEEHCLAGAKLAEPILIRNRFNEGERRVIIEGIRLHRAPGNSILALALAQADDLSRDCHHCRAADECYKYDKMMKLHQALDV